MNEKGLEKEIEMGVLSELEPKRVFHYFEEICNIPHGSYNEKQISDYLVAYAKEHSFEYYQDSLYNVVMLIPASAGYEKEEPVILQGHMDMVCEKKPGASIDMNKDGLELAIDGDYVYAKDTTLGGDDGIAVAYMLAIAEDKEIAHPPLELVFTVSEEVGMDGAAAVDLSMLKGNRMLKIDSEEEGIFLTSCAGGLSAHVTIPVVWETSADLLWYEVTVSGLLGGHSGVEIDKERANSNVVMGRVLYTLKNKIAYKLQTLEGGSKDNAIPLYTSAVIGMKEREVEAAKVVIAELNEVLKGEYAASDAGIEVSLLALPEKTDNKLTLDERRCDKVLAFLMSVPNGVQAMSMSVPGLVETSLNMGVLKLTQEHLFSQHAVRSSVPTRKYYIADQLKVLANSLGGQVECKGEYPAWEYKKESVVRDRVVSLYREMYGKEPVMEGIHAGLECGLLADKIPNLDCVSMGPDILDIHTPMERLSISSTKRVYEFLLAFLKQR